jgi:hypothetical protein
MMMTPHLFLSNVALPRIETHGIIFAGSENLLGSFGMGIRC